MVIYLFLIVQDVSEELILVGHFSDVSGHPPDENSKGALGIQVSYDQSMSPTLQRFAAQLFTISWTLV